MHFAGNAQAVAAFHGIAEKTFAMAPVPVIPENAGLPVALLVLLRDGDPWHTEFAFDYS